MTGFNIGCAINNASSWICGSTMIKRVMENPIFTGLLITALVMIVLMGQYYSIIKDEGSTKIAKTMIYVFLLITAVMFVHSYAFKNNIETSSHQAGVRDMFSSIQQTRNMSSSDFIPVVPTQYMSMPQAVAPQQTAAPQPQTQYTVAPQYTQPQPIPQLSQFMVQSQPDSQPLSDIQPYSEELNDQQ